MEQIKPDKRYLLATEEDLTLNLSLKSNFNDLNEFNNSKLVSLTELFNKERNKSSKYRIYGNINCVSFLTNKKRTQTGVTDFFNDGTSLKLIKPELIGFNLKGEKACLML